MALPLVRELAAWRGKNKPFGRQSERGRGDHIRRMRRTRRVRETHQLQRWQEDWCVSRTLRGLAPGLDRPRTVWRRVGKKRVNRWIGWARARRQDWILAFPLSKVSAID